MELHHMSKKWNHQRSPERTKVWIEPFKQRRVHVVYYLCRNGQLEHPHFVEVPLSSPDGLYLRDVIDRLNSLRGNGMAALYSWSSKRSYKNGFVWHDLSDNDFIYPAHGHEYILKGSELFNVAGTGAGSGAGASFSSKFNEAHSKKSSSVKSIDEFDLHEYKNYSGELSSGRITANAATQTDETRRRRRVMINEFEDEEENMSSVLSRNEISPPPSDSSPETLESLMKSDGQLIVRSETDDNSTPGNKLKASSVLMQLITCGSVSFRDCGPGSFGKENPGISSCRSKMVPRGEEVGDDIRTGENVVVLGSKDMSSKKVAVEDKKYFSGSIIEREKDEFPALKRSNSFNANG
ncbi:protein SOSEKI 5-like [Rutidosis leptorrhynchoides]|uniref:protein SOSEKI 5-like n=1 Tax=Rutidosis leptorrhynchoides TaxID=125765 RepID=UPI003A99AACC